MRRLLNKKITVFFLPFLPRPLSVNSEKEKNVRYLNYLHLYYCPNLYCYPNFLIIVFPTLQQLSECKNGLNNDNSTSQKFRQKIFTVFHYSQRVEASQK